jgi:hypothetical protein
VPLELAPLIEASVPAAPVEPEPPPERTSARRSVPFGRVLVEEPRRPKRHRVALIAGIVVLVVAGGASAVVFDLIPVGGGPAVTGNPAPSAPEVGSPPAPVTDSAGADSARPTPVDTAPAPRPVATVPAPVRPADPVPTRADTAVLDTTLPPPTAIIPPVVTVPTPPIAALDTAAAGPPTVRVPPGTSLRDLLIVVPALPVESVVVVPVSGRRGHRVVQRLPDGEPLVLTSAPMAGSDTVGVSDARITVAGDTTVGSVRFWSFLVTARARTDADTLARLLRRLVRARPVR